jgi:hypothetical protein
MNRLDRGMIATDGQRLGVGQRFLQGVGKAILSHGVSTGFE